MSDALIRRRSWDNVRYASDSDRIAAPRWTVEMGQGTKSLRDSPLRGEPNRENGSQGQDRR